VPKNHAIRFAVGSPEGPQSPEWRLWSSRNTSDVFLAARTIAGQAKVTFHESGRWRLAFTEEYASDPNPYVQPGEDRATAKWRRPPEVAPGITRAFFIMVPASELTSPKVESKSHPDTVWVSPAPSGLATCLTIYFITPDADIGHIRSLTRPVGDIELRNEEIVWVVTHDQPMTEGQKTILAKGRVEVARSSYHEGRLPEEFNSAFFFALEKDVGFFLMVSDKGLTSTSEGW